MHMLGKVPLGTTEGGFWVDISWIFEFRSSGCPIGQRPRPALSMCPTGPITPSNLHLLSELKNNLISFYQPARLSRSDVGGFAKGSSCWHRGLGRPAEKTPKVTLEQMQWRSPMVHEACWLRTDWAGEEGGGCDYDGSWTLRS